MELYKLTNSVQEAVNYSNSNKGSEILSVIGFTENTIVCPFHQSLPENLFQTIDCTVATTKMRGYMVGLTTGDIAIDYIGDNREEVRDFLINYVKEKKTSEFGEACVLRDENNDRIFVYIVTPGGMEFIIYGPNQFSCNSEEITTAANTDKGDAWIDIDDLISQLETKFSTTSSEQLPETEVEEIKNQRGVLRSCNTGSELFETKTKIKRVKTPLVWDETQNANVPKTSMSGFGGLNNTTITDGYFEGDMTIRYQDDEETEAEELLERKGEAEWQSG